MSFYEVVQQARDLIQRNGRVSLRGLKREFDLDDEALEELVEELVDIQQVAAREGKALAWIGGTGQGDLVETVAESPSAPEPAAEAERRQLTVLFCDLVGSTDLSQRLDAEDWRNMVRAYQEAASSVMARYEGHVAQYLGDGLLVYFGWPQAHEDDAERAVRAGREILTALGTANDALEAEHGIRLAVRIGIHTGPVVVGEMGSGSKSETLALGGTTNIAARLEGVAEPDSVVISGATLRLVPGLFVTQDLGTPPLKGIAEPIRAHAVLQATGVRSRLDVDPSRLTPLVGRDLEVGLLAQRWEQVQEGEGQAVLISGEAGVGKSRLIHAFRERLAEAPHGWLECRCSPYTQGSALHPWIELVEQGMGLKQGDDASAKLGRLERGVALAGLSAPDIVPLLAPLLSVSLPEGTPPLDLPPELQRKKTLEALVAWIFALADRQPLVLLVEDLHWSDPSTLELLGLLLEQSPRVKLLILLSFRPAFEPPWARRSHLTSLAVKGLTRRQARNLISGATRGVPLPDEVVQRVVERADGVPLFVEELTKMVLESGMVEEREGRYELTGPLAELAIPMTLQDSLMARIDRLDAGREVAQLGATLGREFFYRLLRSVSLQEEPRLQAGLAQLVDAEILYQRGALPDADFTFKHALVRDAAYHSLLKSVRQQFHAQIARALEEEFPERVESQPEVIARHCDEAGLVEQAAAHYQRAGERAAGRWAHQEAVTHLRRAVELLGELPPGTGRDEREFMLQFALARSLYQVGGPFGAEYEGALERASELRSTVEDAPELPRVLAMLATAYGLRGDGAAGIDVATRALAAAERDGGAGNLVLAHAAAAIPRAWQGDWVGGLQHLERVLALYDPQAPVFQADALAMERVSPSACAKSWCHFALGHPDRALATVRDAVAIADALATRRNGEQGYANANARFWLVANHSWRREVDAVLAVADEAIALSERLGFPFFAWGCRGYRGWALAKTGRVEAGIEELEPAVREHAPGGFDPAEPLLYLALAETLPAGGRHDDALGALQRCASRCTQYGVRSHDAELHRLQGEILLDRDGRAAASEAEALFRRSLEIARGQQARSYGVRAATSLARLWQSQGKRAEARGLLQPLYEWFTEGFDTQDLMDARALLDELA